MKNILLVDGYNMIGSWKELRPLRDTNFEDARRKLIEVMAEYKAAMDWRVIIVFDAHLVPGVEQSYIENDVEVIYTRKNETADERIEKMTRELKARNVQIHVATSDMAEQSVIFGNGALRKSARELEIDTSIIQHKISHDVRRKQESKPPSRIELKPDVALAFEKWRRGLK
ncbi:NYN domain-containing protein [Lysinibacillus sp. Y5S-8]|uniref:NYN domain-containing protein n=1 Tax=Lysinibacillus sp. Y5S-8 TaxID=3122488 RepID=UPI00114DC69E